MRNIPVSDIIERIHNETGLAKAAIKDKLEAKLKTLDGLVSKEGAAFIIASELGVKLLNDVPKLCTIDELSPGDMGIETAGKITRIYPVRTFAKKDGSFGEVGSIVIADSTGTARVVFWDRKTSAIKESTITEGDIIRIKDATIKQSNFGGKEIHLNARSFIAINPENLKIDAKVPVVRRKKISEVTHGENASLLGVIVRVFPPRFYPACKDCNKKVVITEDGGFCPQHNKVEYSQSMLVSFVIDDSTDTIRGVCFRNTAEMVCGFTSKEGYEILTKDGENILATRVEEYILGKTVQCSGSVKENKNVSQPEIMVNSINLDPDPKDIAEKLLENKDG